jgi:peroxiredoxin
MVAVLVGTIAAIAFAPGVVQAVRGYGMAPHVDYTLLDGTSTNSDAWRGKVVLVSFWSTDCSICVDEIPKLVATHQKFQARGFDTVAVSMSYDPPAYVIRFAEARKLPFGVAIDNTGEIARRFGHVEVTPTSMLIDRHGKIVRRFVGEPDFEALSETVEQLLAQT